MSGIQADLKKKFDAWCDRQELKSNIRSLEYTRKTIKDLKSRLEFWTEMEKHYAKEVKNGL
jgi:hypothetical protein